MLTSSGTIARVDSAKASAKRPWAAYAMEAVGIAVFMLFASLFSMLLFDPGSPVAQATKTPAARYVLLGLAMFPVVLFGIVDAPWGRRSGAHINPAVTLAFWRLGKISALDAALYVAAQFLGATAAVGLIALVAGRNFTGPPVNYATTRPGPAGPTVAFAIEFVTTFVLMMLILWASNDAKLERRLPLYVSALISAFLMTATPYTGMSLNPARSFGSAFWARDSPFLWIYFAAPIAGTLLAAEVYRRRWPHRLNGPSYPPLGLK